LNTLQNQVKSIHLEKNIDLTYQQFEFFIKRERVNVVNQSGVNFTNVLRTAFTLVDPKNIKNTVKSSSSFYAFGVCERKSCK
jgi:hypothetical protein